MNLLGRARQGIRNIAGRVSGGRVGTRQIAAPAERGGTRSGT